MRGFSLVIMRLSLFLGAVIALFFSSCAHHQEPQPVDFTPLDQRLSEFARLHNQRHYDALRAYFAKNAVIQLPATPRSSSVEQYLKAVQTDPSTLAVSGTEIVYSFPGRAATRSALAISSSGQATLREQLTVDWVLEDGYWRISRMIVTGWTPILGTWRRSGQRGEGSIELRVLPDGSYLVYLGEDYLLPAFRGRYVLEGNKITFTDSSAADSRLFQAGSGSYVFVRTANGMTLRAIEENNTWRAERYEGAWLAGR